MGKQLKVRMAAVEDVPTLVRFLNETPGNLFDSKILNYPTLKVVCAYDEHGPVAFLPMQGTITLESLAVRPGTEPIAAAAAFRDLVKSAELLASQAGVKELYFACADEAVIGAAERHGFEVLPWKVLRIKL